MLDELPAELNRVTHSANRLGVMGHESWVMTHDQAPSVGGDGVVGALARRWW